MEQNVFFTKFEVIGETKKAAIDSASPMNLMVDATQAWKKFNKENAVSEDNMREWLKDYLRKKKFDKPNMGAYIVLQSAVGDTRERPYKVDKPKYDAKTHSPEKFYVLRDKTGNEVGRAKTSKDAEQKAKEFVTDFKEDLTINYEWVAKEKNSLYATVKYTPSKGSQPCKLLVFGFKVAE